MHNHTVLCQHSLPPIFRPANAQPQMSVVCMDDVEATAAASNYLHDEITTCYNITVQHHDKNPTALTAASSISRTACCVSRSALRKCLSARSSPPCCSKNARKIVLALSRRATKICASVTLKWRRQGSRNAAFWSPKTIWET